MTQLIDAPRARTRDILRRDYDFDQPSPLLGWMVAIPCGVILWILMYWTVLALVRVSG